MPRKKKPKQPQLGSRVVFLTNEERMVQSLFYGIWERFRSVGVEPLFSPDVVYFAVPTDGKPLRSIEELVFTCRVAPSNREWGDDGGVWYRDGDVSVRAGLMVTRFSLREPDSVERLFDFIAGCVPEPPVYLT